MNADQAELHLIKTTLHLKKVSITVRFPCSISFSIKHQNNIVEHRGVYELKGGESLINQSVDIQLEVPYTRGKYEPVKVNLLICMVSANGKIPAGTVTLNPTEKIVIDKKSPLEKCPDKNAEVTYTMTFEKLQFLRKVGDFRKSRVNLAASNVSGAGYNYMNRSQTQQYASSSNLFNKADPYEDNRITFELPKREEPETISYKNIEERSLKNSKVGSQGEKVSFTKFSKNRFDEVPKRTYGTSQRDPSQSRVSRASNQVNEGMQWQIESQRSKILKLEQEKMGHIKTIAKLKGSLVRVESEERFHIEDELNKVSYEKSHLQEEVQRLREKSKFQEKRERQSGSLMKELRDELDKKKSRIIQLDSSKHQIESQLSEKDRLINTLQAQKRKIQQQLQQERVVQQSLQKRIQLKEASYKDQLKKTNDKYSQSQTERQKAMLDYNNLLLQIENAEKRNQTQLRDKDKAFTEEKNKLNKRIEALLSEQTELQEKIMQSATAMRDLEYFKKKAVEEERQREEKMKILKDNFENVQFEKKRLQEQKKTLEQELKQMESLFNEDKVNYKKKYVDVTNQLTSLKEKYDKTNIVSTNQQAKIKELEGKLERQTKEKISINAKFQELKKHQQKLMEEDQNRQRLAQTLSMQNLTQNNRITEIKSKLQAERKRYESMQKKYEEQVQYLVKSKDYLENEIEEMKWLMEKQAEKYQVLSIKHRDLNEQMIEHNQQIIQLQERLVVLQQEKQELQNKIHNLDLEINHLQSKNKVLNDTLKKKEEEYFSVEKKGSSYQQEIYLLQENLQSTIRSLNEKIEKLEQTLQNKNNQLRLKDEELNNVNEECFDLKTIETKLKTEINNKNFQIVTLKDLNKAIKQDFNALVAKNQVLKESQQSILQRVEEHQNSLKSLNSAFQQASQALNKKTSQYEQYKTTCKRIFEQLLIFFSKEEFPQNKKELTSLELFPDETIASLQTECTKKFYNNTQRLQQTIKENANTITYLEQDIHKQKQQMDKMIEEYEHKLETFEHNQKVMKEEHLKESQEHQEKINEYVGNLQEKKVELEFLRSSISKYEDMITQFTDETLKSQEREAQLKTQIDLLEKEIFSFKEKDVKGKVMAASETEDLKRVLKEEKDRNEETINNLKEAVKTKDKLINEKTEDVKRYVLIESQLQLKQEKLVVQINELKTKLDQESTLRKNIAKTLQEKQKNIKELQEEIAELKVANDLQRQICKQKDEQIKRVTAQSHIFEDKLKALEEDYQTKLNLLTESQRKEREKRDKLEAAKSKLQQQNKQTREKNVRLQSQVQFYKFYKQESSKKLEEYEKMKEESYMEMIRCKENVIRSQKQIGNFENKHYKLEMEIENITKERDRLQESNEKLREKLEDLEQASSNFNRTVNELQSREKDISRLQETIRSLEQQHDKSTTDLRNTITKLKEELSTKSSKIKEFQQKIDELTNTVNLQKDKILVQFTNERNMYQLKLQTLSENARVLEQELQFQKQQSIKEIQGANAIIQELNEVIRQKQETLQYKQEIINQQNVRLDEMNLQLSECVNKWQKEKEIYMPASTKVAEISEQLQRMNQFISDLDGRNKQLLEINKRKMQQTLESKPNITEILKELYILMQKNKNKILNRCQTEKEKETVVLEFKQIQEKLDLTLKNTQIVAVKQ